MATKSKRFRAAVMVTAVLTVFGIMTVLAEGRSAERNDTPLYSLRSSRAAGTGVQKVSVNYLEREDNSNALGFDEINLSGCSTRGLVGESDFTDQISGCYTEGCYTCYPSASCYQTCYANPCAPSVNGTCNDPGCESMQGTCHTDCYQETCVIPCGDTYRAGDLACWIKLIANDPGILSMIPCDW
ncbi:MAG: hypothetical protein GF417_09040 [Candidatus Latescibacteria bacterium]|nr:hypothetical protein [bacterium]MBD3424568.1 hypothetical protein [Candidatus Latescibacterota bacterium]